MYTLFVELTYSVDDAVNKAGYGRFQIQLLILSGVGWVSLFISQILFITSLKLRLFTATKTATLRIIFL